MFKWLLLLIAYLPFQIALNPRPGIDLASLRLFIVLFSGFWLVRASINKSWPNRVYFKNLQSLALLFFLGLAFFSLIGAENSVWGLRKIVFFLSVFPLFFLVLVSVNNWLQTRKAILLLTSGGLVIALIGLGQFLAQFIFGLEKVYQFWAVNVVPLFAGFNLGAMILAYPSWLVNLGGQTVLRAFSLFSDPHIFSFYLGLLLPLSFVLYLKERKPFLLFNSTFLFIALLFTFTRGAYLAVIVSFLALAVLIWKHLQERKAALGLALALLIFLVPGTPIANRFYSSFDLNDGSNQGRLEMWQQAGQSGLKNLWQGIGLGNYSLLVEPDLDYRNPATAHNLYLDIFSEMGLFALIIWLVLILGTLVQLVRRLTRFRQAEKYLSLALIGSLVYLTVHSFFETAIYSPIILAILMIILSLSTIVVKRGFD